MGDTAVDRVVEARLCLVADGADSIVAFLFRDVIQQLGNVAGTKHLVHHGKVRSSRVLAEVRREDAVAHVLATQELERPAWPGGTKACTAGG